MAVAWGSPTATPTIYSDRCPRPRRSACHSGPLDWPLAADERVKRGEVASSGGHVKIQSSSLQFVAQHALLTQRVRQESLKAWVGARPSAATTRAAPSQRFTHVPDGSPSGSGAAQGSSLRKTSHHHPVAAGSCERCEGEDEVKLDAKWELIKLLVERMIGRKIRLRAVPTAAEQRHEPARAHVATGSKGWGIEYDLKEITTESEETRFAATGSITTADGRAIRFDLDVRMSRYSVHEAVVHFRAGDAAVDPLVVNIGGGPVQLGDATFEFDLDADGDTERIPFVGAKSGLLVLDANLDGRANDGRELFGPTTGNAFAELAALDRDHNGWVDEADPDWGRLGLWTRDGNGKDTIAPLSSAGIGALHVGSTTTDFDIKDAGNALQGRLVASGLYVAENGSVGSLQQVNFAV